MSKELVATFKPYELLKQEQSSSKVELDFEIADFEFICEKNKRYKVYGKDNLEMFYSDDFFVKNFDKITQKFFINILPKKDLPFELKLKADSNLAKIEAKITSNRPFSYYENLKRDLYQCIYKTLAKNNLLTLRLDKNLDNNLENYIQAYKNGEAIQEFEFLLALGSYPIEHQNDEAIFYKQAQVKQIYDEGIYANPVPKDCLLFEYIYRKMGREGRNLRGEILNLEPLKFIDNPFVLKDESIYKIEFADRAKYYANDYGFLRKDDRGFFISNTIQVSQVDLKNTGSIKTNVDENTVVEVLYNDVIEDAVKSGIVNIQSSDVKIRGSVGATKLNAKNLEIKGVTHKKSDITSKNAYIKTHKGFLEAENVYIENLEDGIVRAKNVYVKNCLSAKIEAQNIYIENLLNNNKLYPKKTLVIENSIKNLNLIHISPVNVLAADNTNDEYKNIKDLSIKVAKELELITTKMQNLYRYLVSNQVRVLQYKKDDENGNLSDLQERLLKLYENNIDKYNSYVKQYENIIYMKHKIHKKIDFFDTMCFKVNVYIKALNIGEANILAFYPQGSRYLEFKKMLGFVDTNKKFTLVKDDNNETYIKSKKNFNEIELENLKAYLEKLTGRDDFYEI